MALVNEHFLKFPNSYFFSDMAKRVNSFRVTHPKADLLRIGIGDVTRPMPKVCAEAMCRAALELTDPKTFRGYGPEQGYDFLIDAILKHEYASRGISLSPSEIFINDGAKGDTGGIVDILRHDNNIGVATPTYPVYIDSNVMWGRAGMYDAATGTWSNVNYLPCTEETDFKPKPPKERVDILYLCLPNNPTGTTLTKTELKKWVDYALKNDTLILFDAAYERFIRSNDTPHSIYEIRGAKKCAIEFRSFSKTAGFTGVRCGYTVIPKELTASTLEGEPISLNQLWLRRQSTKFNGTSYIVQRGAEAIYTPEGIAAINENMDYYLQNATNMKKAITQMGLKSWGGENSPYIWVKTPNGESSWKFFERMLYEANVIVTPGVGFGPGGEGFVRLAAFCSQEESREALKRIASVL